MRIAIGLAIAIGVAACSDGSGKGHDRRPLVPLASSAQAVPPTPGSALTTCRPPELKHSAVAPAMVTPAATSDSTPHCTVSTASPANIGTVRTTQNVPPSAALVALLQVSVSVRKNTTWR